MTPTAALANIRQKMLDIGQFTIDITHYHTHLVHSDKGSVMVKHSLKARNLIMLGRKGALSCLLHWSPKFYNSVFLFIDSTTLGTVLIFD